MKRKLVAAIWSRNTYMTEQGDTIATRLLKLRKAVKKAAGLLQAHAGGDAPRGIFLAPEYLFAEPVAAVGRRRRHSYTSLEGGQQRRHVDENQRDYILNMLKDLSRGEGAGLLLVPGTTAWYKAIANVNQALDLVNRAEARGIHQAGPSKSLEYDPVTNNIVPTRAQIPQIATYGWKRARLNSLVAIDKSVHDYAQKNGISDEQAQQRRDNATEARNTAYVLYGGNEVFVYDKQGDFHEVLDYDTNRRNIYIPGVKNGIFSYGGIDFGIEVCLDHAMAVLKGHHGYEAPHVHLICSAAVKVDPNSLVVKRGGVALHACCVPEFSGVWRSSTVLGNIKDCTQAAASDEYVKFLGAEDVAGAELRTYEINLEC
jgi:hypothetical protein